MAVNWRDLKHWKVLIILLTKHSLIYLGRNIITKVMMQVACRPNPERNLLSIVVRQKVDRLWITFDYNNVSRLH